MVDMRAGGGDSFRRFGQNLGDDRLVIARFGARDTGHDSLAGQPAFEKDHLAVHVGHRLAVERQVGNIEFYQFIAQVYSSF